MEYYGIVEFDGFRKFLHEDWVFQQQTYNIQHPVKQLQYKDPWFYRIRWGLDGDYDGKPDNIEDSMRWFSRDFSHGTMEIIGLLGYKSRMLL